MAPTVFFHLLLGLIVGMSFLLMHIRTRGTGRFNLAQGALASFVGIGAALSTTYGGYLIGHFGYNTSFLACPQ